MNSVFFKELRSRIQITHPRLFALAVTLLAGGFLLMPYVSFQGFLAQGDHGRELYCVEQVMNGAVPYRDFFWNYGPLPLYYYALFFKLFGVSINAILLGRVVLFLLSGFFIFQSLSLFVPLRFASLGAIWFWFFNPDFHYTYCYTSGITVLMALIFALLLYVKQPRPKYIAGALACVFLISLIKINFGITSLLAVILSLAALDWGRQKTFAPKRWLFYAAAFLGLPLLVILVYACLLYKLAPYEIYQCFPFLPQNSTGASSPPPYGYSAPSAAIWWLRAQWLAIFHSWNNLIMAFLLWLSIGLTLAWGLKKDRPSEEKKHALAAFLILALCYFLTLLEFLISGVPYRAAWAQPFGFVIIFLFFGLGFRQVRMILQVILIGALCFKVFSQHQVYLKQMAVFKNSGKFFETGRGRLIVANSPSWIQTVQGATRYLNTRLAADETFYAVPYDPLYYFLTQRTAPSRIYSLYVFYSRIPAHQEQQIIADLERKKLNYILISNRQKSTEGLGTFGKDYCPLLFSYIHEHFKEVATFGNWEAPAGWVDGHAVKILKRLPALSPAIPVPPGRVAEGNSPG